MEERIASVLREHYGIETRRIHAQPGGWSALAYLSEAEEGKYFVKAYDRNRLSCLQWADAASRYMPLLVWLQEHTELSGHIPRPLLTGEGAYTCGDDEYVYVATEYIEGEMIGEKPFTMGQIAGAARILGLLHASTADIPAEILEKFERETSDTAFCDDLSAYLDGRHGAEDEAWRLIAPYTDHLYACIQRSRELADALKRKPRRFVLCHADAHRWNLIQGKALALIDWECARIAPPEQDVILYVGERYFPQFLSEYRKHWNYGEPDLDALEFYWLQRILVDIKEWLVDLHTGKMVQSKETIFRLMAGSLAESAGAERFRGDVRKALAE